LSGVYSMGLFYLLQHQIRGEKRKREGRGRGVHKDVQVRGEMAIRSGACTSIVMSSKLIHTRGLPHSTSCPMNASMSSLTWASRLPAARFLRSFGSFLSFGCDMFGVMTRTGLRNRMRVDSRREYLRMSGQSAVAPLKLGRNIWIFGGRMRFAYPCPLFLSPPRSWVEDMSMLQTGGVGFLPRASAL
jgi:hypothetical protein